MPRLRFGLRPLFAATTLLAVLLGLLAGPVVELRRQHELAARAAALGGVLTQVGSQPREASITEWIIGVFDSSATMEPVYRADFSGSQLTDDQFAQFAGLRHVRELVLDGTKVTDRGLEHVARFKELAALSLRSTKVTDRGLANLAQVSDLESLSLAHTSVSYEALHELEQRFPESLFCEQRAIEELQSRGVQIVSVPRGLSTSDRELQDNVDGGHIEPMSDATVAIHLHAPLAAEDGFRLGQIGSLRDLLFKQVALAEGGLSRLRPLPSLRKVQVFSTNLSDEDLAAIARQPALIELMIAFCPDITDAGVAEISKITSLKKMSLHQCRRVSDGAGGLLAVKLPGCRIDFAAYDPRLDKPPLASAAR